MAATLIIKDVKWGEKKSLSTSAQKKNMLNPAVESQADGGQTRAKKQYKHEITKYIKWELNRRILQIWINAGVKKYNTIF